MGLQWIRLWVTDQKVLSSLQTVTVEIWSKVFNPVCSTGTVIILVCAEKRIRHVYLRKLLPCINPTKESQIYHWLS